MLTMSAVYGSYQTVIYYLVLMAQEVDELSAGETAIRFLPMGAGGFIVSLVCGRAIEVVNGKFLLLMGMALSVLAPVPSCLTAQDLNLYVLSLVISDTWSIDNYSWTNVLPTSLISVTGVSIAYITASTTMLASVPVNVKSLCGGMVRSLILVSYKTYTNE